MPLEKTIVAGILRTLNQRAGVYARKTHGGGYSTGWPDIVVCASGRLIMLEVKRPGGPGQRPGQVTALQERELDRWEAAGAVCAVVRSIAEATAVVDGALDIPGLK